MKNLAANLTHRPRKWDVPILAFAAALGMVMWCSGALAQSGAGSIQGTVTDVTGAVIPGATIRAVNPANGTTASATSNGVGFFQVPGLFAGTYNLTATASSMKTYKVTVQLLVDQRAVVNPVMTAGEVTQEVEVAANVVQLTTTENGTIATTLESERINQLPMNQRQLTTLAGMTTPGLEGGTRANGLFGEAMEYVADGVSLSNRQFGGNYLPLAQEPDPDSVQEMRIETSNTSAQFSSPGTAIITTKSGTNTIHGTLFETARNNGIGIAKNRNNPYNWLPPHYIRNEFGVSAGGPIVLPKIYHGKDKSFWFLAYERYSLASYLPELVTVPTMAMRGGDYSGLINGAGNLQVLYDPATTVNSPNCNGTGNANTYCRTPFLNNQIPIGRLAPMTKTLFDITPTPGTTDNPLIKSNLSAPNINNQTVPTITFRLDHGFNEANKVYLRYTQNVLVQHTLRNYPSNSPATIAADGFPDAATGLAYNPSSTFATALGYTHVFSPTFFAETILSNQWFGQHNYAGGSPFTNYEQKLGIPNNFGELGFPSIASGAIMPYGGTQFQYGLSQIISNIDENLTKTVGRHQMQFGGRYRHERFGYYGQTYDYVNFGNNGSGVATALVDPKTGTGFGATTNTGNINGDLFLGAASSYQIGLPPPYVHFHDMEFDGYFQDNFHVTRNLTVNLGVRYENHPGAWTKDGLTQSFDFKNKAIVMTNPTSYYVAHGYTTQAIITNLQNLGVVFETAQQAGYPSTMMKNYPVALSPRVGFAYQLFGGKNGMVLRGAYGRYIYPMPVRNFLINPPMSSVPYVANYIQSYINGNQSPDGLNNYLMRAPQTVIAGQNSANVINTASLNAITPGVSFWTFNPDFPPDFVTQTNVTLEKELKGNSALRLSWVYTHGTNLDQYYYPNNHPSNYVWYMQQGVPTPTGTYAGTGTGPYDQTFYSGGMTWDQKGGWSNDHALQASYQRLFHHGIAYQINYVWSRPLRIGGNYFRDSSIYPFANYVNGAPNTGVMASPYGTLTAPVAPPTQPTNIARYAMTHEMNRFQNYHLDTAIPLHHITFNGVVDLPVGRGKKFLGNSNRFLDELVGGFQLAGDGSIATQDFGVASGNWGPTNPIKVYKHSKPITDCRSGVCRKSYMWFNGYLAPKVQAGNSCATTGQVVSNLPSDYAPYSQPIDNDCTTANYGTNYVTVSSPALNASNKGNPVNVPYSPGPQGTNPYSQTYLNGPINYTIDLSLFKVFPITERVKIRFNVDAFNALNMMGYNNPNTTDGTQAVEPNGGSNSYNTPRQIQLTLRMNF